MNEQRFKAGQSVYREGDPSDTLFVIAQGEVEVLRKVDGKHVRLAVLGKGAVFGEMGVIRDTPRSTTVRALDAVTVVAVPKDTFLSTFRHGNPLALHVLHTLCERLVQADAQLIAHRLYSEAARLADVHRVHMLPASAEMQTQIGSEGVEVTSLPFRVGRHLQPGEGLSAGTTELTLKAAAATQVSPLHFAVESDHGRLIVRDLKSHLGTVVNGRRIAHFENSESADLLFGENTVQAGGLESPYAFRIIVERVAG